jgi:asparagine synthetase B (glutamine-hydrolysing)
MCGIAFVINYNTKNKVNLDIVKSMFISMKKRGTDASGIYWEREDGSSISRKLFKSPIESDKLWELVQSDKTPEHTFERAQLFGTERLIMLHTRNMTQGNEADNHNNMPIYSKNYVLVHNGVIHAERSKSYAYNGAVDSEEILAKTEEVGLKKALSLINGSMAIAIKKIVDDELFIYRRNNPLYLLFFKDQNVLFGCSLADYVPHINKLKQRLGDGLFKSGCSILEVPEGELFKLSIKHRSIEREGNIVHEEPAKSVSAMITESVLMNTSEIYQND